MSNLIIEVCKIEKIKPHSNANKLSLVQIKKWQCVVGKDEYKEGDKIIFIPPDALIPDELAEKLNIKNYLAGKAKNRVKQIKLRGEMSYGLIIPNIGNWKVGYDCSKDLGIIKYEPPVRMGISDAAPEDPFFPKMEEVQNIRNYPDIYKEGQMVAVTEKLDGSNFRISIGPINEITNIPQECYPLNEDYTEFAIWKAGSHKVNRKRPETLEEMKKNIYWFPYLEDPVYNLLENLILYYKYKSVILFGEIFGEGISGGSKSLNYGVKKGLDYRAFGLSIDGKRICYKQFIDYCKIFNVKTVPLIKIIPYNFEEIEKLSTGLSYLADENGASHMREGVVIHSYEDEKLPSLKCLNPDYLLLKEKGIVPDFKDE